MMIYTFKLFQRCSITASNLCYRNSISNICVNLLITPGKTYNIPIKLWLIETHPYNPPMVYVNPTANMQIKPGRHVDTTGRIYLPYLHEWKHVSSVVAILLALGFYQNIVYYFEEYFYLYCERKL